MVDYDANDSILDIKLRNISVLCVDSSIEYPCTNMSIKQALIGTACQVIDNNFNVWEYDKKLSSIGRLIEIIESGKYASLEYKGTQFCAVLK